MSRKAWAKAIPRGETGDAAIQKKENHSQHGSTEFRRIENGGKRWKQDAEQKIETNNSNAEDVNQAYVAENKNATTKESPEINTE